jgi:RNA polymerase sigma-70 factor (ECF subfamily)
MQNEPGIDPRALAFLAGDTHAVHAAYAAGRRAWSGISLSYEQFHSHVSRLGYASLSCAAEVYLCAACTNRQKLAYRALENAYFPPLTAIIHQFVGEKPAVDDVVQEIRTRLFVGRSPKIATYRGRGSLGGWLRRVAINASQDRRRAVALECRRFYRLANAQPSAVTTPELDDDPAFQSQRAQHCKRTLIAAILSLAPADRQLLFHHFVTGLSIDALGPLYSVHRATVARRIRRAAALVRMGVHQELALHYPDLNSQELQALLLHVAPYLDLCEALA